ncbi:MAG: class 1 fructose-bisphosphatase [Bacteroidales bacterium]|nr:class 1 fructose-bisphosphatase [Bacteroidales bacterium]MBK7174604.1 class 1 fructose-bisphosphatase [Bacteroidales bacterium]
MKTLVEFINDKQTEYPGATGEFTRLLNDITIAAKIVNREIRIAGLADINGLYGTTNIQGEDQQKLDVYANNQFINALKHGGQCAAIASEENEDLIIFGNAYSQKGDYVVAMDPVDGSSNIEVNVPIGTIFSVYKRKSPSGSSASVDDLLQNGRNIVAAGYVIYGSSTILVYTTGNGVNGFTYDPSVGLFFLSHPDMKIPEDGNIYSINEANYIYFPDGVKKYIKYCQVDDKSTNRPYNTRYIGSLVADVHRNMLRGGIFIYPGNQKNPVGKLRLLYECAPMAYIIEQAGGKASDGFTPILDIEPYDIHQRSPLFIGSRKMVEKAEEFMYQNSKNFSELH